MIEEIRSNAEPMEQPPAPSKRKETSQRARDRHAKIYSWFLEEKARQYESRFQQALDEDFYDNLQWSADDVADLADRYQAPLTFNLIHTAVQWLTGSERKMKFDYDVLPRGGEDVQGSGVKKQVLKYVHDANQAAWKRSQAFKDAAVAGVGWLESFVQNDPTEDPIKKGNETWRNVWYDSLNRELTQDRSRYVFRARSVDLDIGLSLFPGKQAILERAARSAEKIDRESEEYFLGVRLSERESVDDGWIRAYSSYSGTPLTAIDSTRERVPLIEAQYRMPMRVKIMKPRAPDVEMLRGDVFDKDNELHVFAYNEKLVELIEVQRLMVRCAVMTEDELLVDMLSPYNHRRFTLTPVWAYRRRRDGAPYGPVRLMRDPQEDLNKRRSKALWHLSSNRVVADEDADVDIEEIREEAARPDAVLIKKRGAEVRIESSADLAASHVQMEQINAGYLREVSGVTSDNLGLDSNVQSGKAVIAKQTQGSMVSAELFDNLFQACQIDGENDLSLIEQFMTDARKLRIVGPDGTPSGLQINQEQDDGTILNDIAATKADFVIGKADFTQSLRTALFETMMELLGRLPPEVSLKLLPEVIELVDLPQREKLLSKIRDITGEEDPNAPLSPEEAEKRKQRQAQQRQQAELMQATAEAQLKELQSKAEKAFAEAEKARAEADAIEREMGNGGLPSEREKMLLKELQKAQAEAERASKAVLDLEAKIREMKVAAADKSQKTEVDALVKVLATAMATASQERLGEKKVQTERELGEQQLATDKELGHKKIDTDKEVASEKTKAATEVAREKTQADTEVKREVADKQAKVTERVGMAKAKAAPAKKSADKSEPAKESPEAESAEPAEASGMPAIHIHLPAEAIGQAKKGRKKTMTMKKGKDGNLTLTTTEDED